MQRLNQTCEGCGDLLPLAYPLTTCEACREWAKEVLTSPGDEAPDPSDNPDVDSTPETEGPEQLRARAMRFAAWERDKVLAHPTLQAMRERIAAKAERNAIEDRQLWGAPIDRWDWWNAC